MHCFRNNSRSAARGKIRLVENRLKATNILIMSKYLLSSEEIGKAVYRHALHMPQTWWDSKQITKGCINDNSKSNFYAAVNAKGTVITIVMFLKIEFEMKSYNISNLQYIQLTILAKTSFRNLSFSAFFHKNHSAY